MLDPAQILKAADFEVESQDRFAAGPSHDRAIAAAVRATCAAVNTYVRDVVQEAMIVAANVVDDPQTANMALQKLRELAGLE